MKSQWVKIANVNQPPEQEEFDLIMLAAGVGARAGLGYPKQFARLGGKPILIHTLEVFYGMPEIGRIIVTYPDRYEQQTERLLHDYGILDNRVIMVRGGATRQESVRLALEEVRAERVIIHEAVRPFITRDFVRKLIKESKGKIGITPVIPIPFSVGKVQNSETEGIVDRRLVVNIQLPQLFFVDILKMAHEKLTDRSFNEDTGIILEFANCHGYIKAVPGLEQNIKITSPLDLLYAEVLYREGYCGSDRR